MSKSITSVAIVVGTLLALSSACTSRSDAPAPGEPVKIGFLAPLSGPAASVGTDTRRGAELAVEVVNSDYPSLTLPLGPEAGLPDLQHAKLELVSADSNGNPQHAQTQVARLVKDENVAAVAGGYESSITEAASARTEQLKVPFVNGGSSAPSLTERGLEWFFRTGPSDLSYGRVIFSLLKERQSKGVSVKRIAVVRVDNQYGNDGAAVIERLVPHIDGEVVANVKVDSNGVNLNSQAKTVRAAEPDVVLTLLYTPQALALEDTFKQIAYQPPALMAFGAGYADPAFLQKNGRNADGICSRFSWSSDLAQRNPTAKAIAKLYERRFDSAMNDDAARSFTAVMTLAQAVNDAGSHRPADIRSALVNIDIPGRDTIMPWAGVKFDDSHQNIGARGVVEQVQDGQYRLVYPFDVAHTRLEWPIPAVSDL